MSLVNELIKELIDDKQVTAVYGGGFKPPIQGHFYVVKKANIGDKSFTAYKLSRDVIEPVHRAIVQNAFDKQDIDVERINAGNLTDTCFDVKFNFNQLLTITR